MAEFRFTNEHKASEVGNVISVLRRPRLWIPTETDYPGHSTWLEKVEDQIQTGKKRAMLAYIAGKPVGAVVYQRHEQSPNVVEVRNISVSPDSTHRGIASFLLRNTEIEAVSVDFPGTDTIMVDTKITNPEMIQFLETRRYELAGIADLYETGTPDAVFTKPLAA
jgi:N-acetylglutamate synthase-like GNAT family acetyltransferase